MSLDIDKLYLLLLLRASDGLNFFIKEIDYKKTKRGNCSCSKKLISNIDFQYTQLQIKL